jgi:MFS family permease
MANGPTTRARGAFTGGEAFAALRHSNYRLFFIGQLISMCGTWLQMVAQGWLVWRLTSSELAVGLVTASGSAPMFFLSLFGGALADRVDRRRLLLVTQALAMSLAAVLGLLSLQPGLQVWHVAAVAACLGVVSAFDVPARQAFVVQMVDREALMNAIALNSTLFNGARIVGPAVASALIAIPWIGVPGCFFLNSASYIAAIIALALIRTPGQATVPLVGSALNAALEGIRYVARTPIPRRLIILLGVVGVFGWSSSTLMPAMADEVLRGGARTYGWLLTANGAGALVGSLVLAGLGDTRHKRSMIYCGLALFCAALLIFSLSRWMPLSLAALVLAGLGVILFTATGNTVIQSMVPDELRGRVMGLWALVFAGSTPAGSLLAGTIASRWGAPAALQLGAVVMAVGGALVFMNSEQERQREAGRVTAPAPGG